MGPEAWPEEQAPMTPLVTKHFGKEVFTKTQQYDDLATSVTVSSLDSCARPFPCYSLYTFSSLGKADAAML